MTTPASPRQVSYLRDLLAEREGIAAAEDIRDRLNAAREAGGVTNPFAQNAIQALLSIEKVAAQAAAAADPEVPEGRYAVEVPGGEDTDGEPVLRFFRVDRPTEGRWAGRTFVKIQAGDDFLPYRGEKTRRVLDAIAQDPRAAAIRYGHELGVCGRCGRTLTDADSRAAGIGPVCATKAGW